MRTPPQRLVPFAYGAIHAVVDATTVSVIFLAAHLHRLSSKDTFTLVVAYDVLAFATQALFGALTDRLRAPRAVAFAGVLVSLLSVAALPVHAIAAMLLASAGNALFHVGGGSLSLTVDPGRNASPGIFVAPGALGLAFGLWVGRQREPYPTWPFVVALAASLIVIAFVTTPPAAPANRPAGSSAVRGAPLVAALLLFSVAVRSFVGLGAFPKLPGLVIALPFAAFAGKALGGILADRLGETRTGVGALALSAPVIAFAVDSRFAMVIGMFLFQMTMPVTLTGLSRVFPGRPGFAFGFASLALIIGALPTFSARVAAHYTHVGTFGLIALSAVCLYFGLKGIGDGEDAAKVPATG